MKNVVALLALALASLSQIQAAENAETHCARGNALFAQERFPEAAAEFEQALEIDPGMATARFQYAVCLFAEGRNPDSRAQLLEFQQRFGPTHDVQYYLGRLDLLAGDSAAAIRELTPLSADAKIPKASYYLALAYLAAGDQVTALKWMRQADERTPNDYHVQYRLARLYAALGRTSESENEFQLYNQARNYARDTEADLRACSAALEHAKSNPETCARLNGHNDPERLVLLGQIYGDHGSYSNALDPLAQAVKLDPGSYEAWQNLGITFFKLGRYAEARNPLEKASALRPDNFDAVNLLAATLYMLGDDAAALPLMERAHQMKPEDAQLAAALKQLKETRAPNK